MEHSILISIDTFPIIMHFMQIVHRAVIAINGILRRPITELYVVDAVKIGMSKCLECIYVLHMKHPIITPKMNNAKPHMSML